MAKALTLQLLMLAKLDKRLFSLSECSNVMMQQVSHTGALGQSLSGEMWAHIMA